MVLLWKKCRYDNPGVLLTEKNANDYHHAEAEFGKFGLNIVEGRKYKDGTHEYLCRMYPIGSNSYAEFTLIRIRGHLLDAISAAEKALFRYFHLPRMYRLPTECLDIVPAAKKLLDRQPMCFECDSETCAFNPEGVCMYPVVYGKTPDLETFDGCSGWVEKREE